MSTLAAGSERAIPDSRAPVATDDREAAAAPQQVFVDERGIRRRVLAATTLLAQVGLILVASVVIVALTTSIVSGAGPVDLGTEPPAPLSPAIDDARPAPAESAVDGSGGVNLALLLAIGLLVTGVLLILVENLSGRLKNWARAIGRRP